MPLAWLSAQRAVQTLEVYFIDAEGGYATLYVSPSGQSMLVDTGYDGFEGRDATRIWAAAARAGVKQIDYLITTRDHGDHVGRDGACGGLRIRNFVVPSAPRVAVTNTGPRKAVVGPILQTLRASPRLEGSGNDIIRCWGIERTWRNSS